MILNIRGTSGSGKTTLVRAIMAGYEKHIDHHRYGRRQPIYVECYNERMQSWPLYVLGHYNTPCGGCDTITKLDDVFELAKALAEKGNVLMEGLLLSGEVHRTVNLDGQHGFKVLKLSTPVEQCIRNVEARRKARGDDRPLNPRNTILKFKTVESVCKRLANAGVPLVVGDYEALLKVATEALNA